MKKLLAIAALLGTASIALAQGLVDFENFGNSLISTNSVHNGPATGLMSGPAGTMSPFNAPPGSYIFMLFAAFPGQTTVDASLSGWDLVAYGVSTATPGLMNGNITTDPGALLLRPWGSGETANFLVVGWSANIGDNWGEASAWWNDGNPNTGPSGYFGISDIAQDVVIGSGGYPVPTIFGPTVGYEVQGFTLNLYQVPEPSTFALACLGIAALVAICPRSFRNTPSEQFHGGTLERQIQ
jgi:hypothetical protein